MLLRISTGALLIPIVVVLVWWGPAVVVAACGAGVTVIALMEFFQLGDGVGLRAFRKWTAICSVGLFYAQYSQGQIETRSFGGGVSLVRDTMNGTLSVESVLLIFLFGAAIITLGTRRPLHELLGSVSISAGAMVFISLPFSYLARIDEIENRGRELLLFTLCLVWAGDTLAYFVGKSLGRIKMAPALSPKKTWEGAFANLIASLLVAVAFAHWLRMDALALLAIACLANIAGQIGDLLQSTYKRSAGVKDSGTLLPGHGGMLDRIDSLVLACPVVWLAWQWLAAR